MLLCCSGDGSIAAWVWNSLTRLLYSPQVVSPGDPLGPGQIYDSNRTTLTAALREQGFTPMDLGVARDRYERFQTAFTSKSQEVNFKYLNIDCWFLLFTSPSPPVVNPWYHCWLEVWKRGMCWWPRVVCLWEKRYKSMLLTTIKSSTIASILTIPAWFLCKTKS